MAADTIDLVRSLAAVMREETEALGAPAGGAVLAELAAAKQRLLAMLETRAARVERETPGWRETLEPPAREELLAALAELRDAAAPNAAALERRIALSLDLMAAISAEAQRLSGRRHAVYGAAGGISRPQLPSPIAVNSRF
jgi:flagellar biosynthesis/type III secretory pathway chaperone